MSVEGLSNAPGLLFRIALNYSSTGKTGLVVSPGSTEWVDLSTRLVAVEWAKGKEPWDDLGQPGTLVAVLDNQDRLLDPDSTGGTYYGRLEPMRAVDLTLYSTGSTSQATVFHGYLDDLYPGYTIDGVATVEVRAMDLLGYLSAINIPSVSTGTLTPETEVGDFEQTHSRVSRVLVKVGLSSTLLDHSFDGRVAMRGTQWGQTALEMVNDAVLAEGGMAAVYSTGRKLKFRSRMCAWEDTDMQSVSLTFSSSGGDAVAYKDLVRRYTRRDLVNRAAVTPTTADPYNFQSTASVRRYGVQGVDLGSPSVHGNAVSALWGDAQYRVVSRSTFRSAIDRLTAVPVRPDGNTIAQVIGSNVYDRANVRWRPPGSTAQISRDHWVVGLAGRIESGRGSGARTFEMTYVLQDARDWSTTSTGQKFGDVMILGTGPGLSTGRLGP